MQEIITKEGVHIREFRQDMAAYLERAKNGEHFMILRRGVPIAVVSPVGEFDACAVSSGSVHKEVSPDSTVHADNLSNADNLVKCSKCDAELNQKEIADKIVEDIEKDCREANAWMSKDSTDNAVDPGGDYIASRIVENGFTQTYTEGLNPKDYGYVGLCDICSNPSKELWEHEEEGIERSVCKNCFAVRFDTTDKLEKFLRTKKKVEVSGNSHLPINKTFVFHKQATSSDFNPIPKPVKKIKK